MGAVLFSAGKFFEQLNGFNPDTFMFKEEELLYLAVMRAGLHTLYEPALRSRHLEVASTDAVYTTSEAKFNFVRENQIASLKVLIRALDEE